MGLHLLGHAVRRHPFVLLLILVLSGAAAAIVWLFLPLPKLTGTVVYRVASQPPAVLSPVNESTSTCSRIGIFLYSFLAGSKNPMTTSRSAPIAVK